MLPNKYRWLSLAGVVMLTSSAYSFKNDYFEISKNLEIFTNIVKEINASYVDEIDPNKFIRSGIDGMMNSLDPYTDFIPEENLDSYKMTTTGRYGGVGALIKTEGDYVVISEPYEGFPADKAGLRAGDKLLEIDGQSVKKKNTEEVSKMLKGKPNTEVKLLIERPGDSKPITKSVLRQEIHIKSVPYYGTLNDSKTGYIRLTQFTEDCSKDVANALRELKEKNKIQSVILDLRGNPGGLLNEAVDVANIFIPKNKEVVSTRGKRREWDKSYKTENEPVDLQIPLTVLIDEGSASASEIVSGAVQDWDRGEIIGRRSFGKGLVQEQYDLSNGGALRLTVARYHTPSGRCIQKSYEDGIDAYEEDLEHRYEDGELENPDSVSAKQKIDSSQVFKTKIKGRKVYGGGGISPDISVPLEKLSSAFVARARGVVPQFVYNYYSNHQPEFKQYATVDAFAKNFTISNTMFNEYQKIVKTELKILDEKQLNANRGLIETTMKAYFARQLWGNDGFYPIINKEDKTLQKAYQTILN